MATITLDSPANRNALSARLMSDLLAGLRRAVDDPAARVIVLDHTGRVFCSGVDLTESRGGGRGVPVAALPEILELLWTAPKPVVARVGGAARAGGLGLIAACDLAVADQAATFAFTEVRLGVVPAVISATVLPRLAPRAATELFLTGEIFDGARAAAVGLVTAAVPADQLDEAVDGYVRALLRAAPAALAGAKDLLRARAGGSVRAELDRLAELSVRYFAGPDAAEGMAAFAEKRDPSWVPAGPTADGPTWRPDR